MKYSIIGVISFQANFESEVEYMSIKEECMQAEKERICELLQKIDRLDALGYIYKVTSGVVDKCQKKGGAA